MIAGTKDEDGVPLTHYQVEALVNVLHELVRFSQKAMDTIADAKNVCPRCAHQGEEYVETDHPCASCGAPAWPNFVERAT
jgi:hypothetical protein